MSLPARPTATSPCCPARNRRRRRCPQLQRRCSPRSSRSSPRSPAQRPSRAQAARPPRPRVSPSRPASCAASTRRPRRRPGVPPCESPPRSQSLSACASADRVCAPSTDLSCVCSNVPLIEVATVCVQNTCPPADVQTALALQRQVCGAGTSSRALPRPSSRSTTERRPLYSVHLGRDDRHDCDDALLPDLGPVVLLLRRLLA